MNEIPLSDGLGLLWFLSLWAGYTLYADRFSRRKHSLRQAMHANRVAWMRRMLTRENRIMDVNILSNLLQSVSFFASTTLLILAGLLTILGSTDRVIEVVRALPFAAKITPIQWELRLLVLSVIFVYAFFKFTWALRQFNYCSVIVGAAPDGVDDAYARRGADISTLASKDFNQGLRAYYFSLATLGWFLNPWVFAVATALVVLVLYVREYRSSALTVLTPDASARDGSP